MANSSGSILLLLDLGLHEPRDEGGEDDEKNLQLCEPAHTDEHARRIMRIPPRPEKFFGRPGSRILVNVDSLEGRPQMSVAEDLGALI
jgi:hypothetical protein